MPTLRLARFRRRAPAALAFSLLALGLGCGDDDSGTGSDKAASALELRVVSQYVKTVRSSYADTIDGATALQDAIETFLADPSKATLADARKAWIDARPAYLQTESYRFYEGPIDNEENGPEGYINGWPLDESFIDYTVDGADLGIINQPQNFPKITKQVLIDENENGGEDYLSTGYHAIEFLLWGQDLSADGPGDRPYTDYVQSDDGPGANAERRSTYLSLAASLLVDQLTEVADAWKPGAEYGDTFLADKDRVSLSDILLGIEQLTGKELSGERMDAAIKSRDQEDEHSCFSDNTHADYVFDGVGIANVYYGRYNDDDGAGIDDLVKAVDPELDQEMTDALDDMAAKIEAIPDPVDQALLSDAGRAKMMAASDAVIAVHAVIVKITSALKL